MHRTKMHSISNAYTVRVHLIDCNLHVKRLHTYLGVEIDNTMSWSPHIQTVSNRATKVFNFVKRNLGNCPASTKRIPYLTLVRPIMEYAAPVCIGSILQYCMTSTN